MDSPDFFERLCKLSADAFEWLLVAVKVDSAYLSSKYAPQATRALELLRALENRNELDLLSMELPRAEQRPSEAASRISIDGELDEVKQLLKEYNYELAQRSLGRIKPRWLDLSPSRKVRFLSQMGYIHLAQGDAEAAAREYLKAAELAPQDEDARFHEALAHEFLDNKQRAHELASGLVTELPRSHRALALWLRTAPSECSAESQEQLVEKRSLPPDGEVWLAIAARALNQGDSARAEHLARRTTEMDPDWPPGWLLLGAAIYQSILPEGESRRIRFSEKQRERLRQAAESFKKAANLAERERRRPLQIEALIGGARAHDLLDEPQAAERAIRDAVQLKPNDGPLLSFLGSFLREHNRVDEAAQHLAHSLRLQPDPQTEFALALTLSARKHDGDLARATEYFAHAALTAQPALRYHALKCAIQGYLAGQMLDAAQRLLDVVTPQVDALVLHSALRGLVALSAGDASAADIQAKAALAAWTSSTEPIGTGMLADLLRRLERHADALPLWQALFDPESPGYEVDGLLNAAQQLGRDDILLETCCRLRVSGTATANVRRLEYSLLERYDPAAAVELLRDHVENHPNDYVARLGFISCQFRIGRRDSFALTADQIPPAKTVDPNYGEMIVHFLEESGRGADAREYGYQLVRCHYNSIDAHRAYCLSYLSASSELPLQKAELQQIVTGAAVAYIEDGKEEVKWVIIEDSPDPHLALREFPPDDPWIKCLMGKNVNDKIPIPGTGIPGQFAIIKAIDNKYAYRLRDSMQQMTSSFASASGWLAISTPHIEKPDILPEKALKPLLDQFALYNQQARLAVEMYRSRPLSVHAFSWVLGRSPFEAFCCLMEDDSVGIHCHSGIPTMQEAVSWLKIDSIEVVLDLTAVITLFKLNRLELLQSRAINFIISQSTIEEIRREIRNLRPNPRQIGSMHSDGRTCELDEYTDPLASRRLTAMSQLLDTVVSHCKIQSGRHLAAVEPDIRKMLLKFFGQHGAESIILAHERKCLLWTDDGVLASFGATKWGIRRIWTQAAIQGMLIDTDENATIDCSAQLIGWRYQLTYWDLSVLLRAGELTMWNSKLSPLKQIVEIFSGEVANLDLCIQAARQLIIVIEQEAIVKSAAQTTYRIILDHLCSRPGGVAKVDKMIEELPGLIRQRFRLATLTFGRSR